MRKKHPAYKRYRNQLERQQDFERNIEFMYGKNPVIRDLVKRLDLEVRSGLTVIAGAEDLEEIFNKADEKKKQKQMSKQNVRSPRKNNEKETKKSNKNNEKEIVFLEGMRAFTPNTEAPDFVIADFIISPDDLIKFLEDNKDLTRDGGKYGEQMFVTLKQAKGGSLYLEVNTYNTERGK